MGLCCFLAADLPGLGREPSRCSGDTLVSVCWVRLLRMCTDVTADQCRSGSFGRIPLRAGAVLLCFLHSELLRHYRPIEYPPQPKTQWSTVAKSRKELCKLSCRTDEPTRSDPPSSTTSIMEGASANHCPSECCTAEVNATIANACGLPLSVCCCLAPVSRTPRKSA